MTPRIQGPQGPVWTPEPAAEEAASPQTASPGFDEALQRLHAPDAAPAQDLAVQSIARDLLAGRLDDPTRLIDTFFERLLDARFPNLDPELRQHLHETLRGSLGEDPHFMLELERQLDAALDAQPQP